MPGTGAPPAAGLSPHVSCFHSSAALRGPDVRPCPIAQCRARTLSSVACRTAASVVHGRPVRSPVTNRTGRRWATRCSAENREPPPSGPMRVRSASGALRGGKAAAEFGDLLAAQAAARLASQHDEEPGGCLEFLHRVGGGGRARSRRRRGRGWRGAARGGGRHRRRRLRRGGCRPGGSTAPAAGCRSASRSTRSAAAGRRRGRRRRGPMRRPNESNAGARPRRHSRAAGTWHGAGTPPWKADRPTSTLPSPSSSEIRAGSSEPKLEPVGVTSQRSPIRTLMLPVLPWVRPRSNSDRAVCDDRVTSLVFGHAHALAPPFARLARW